MPDPRSSASSTPRAGDEVVEILQRTEGRAFVLFTSYATLRDVARASSARRCPIRCSCRARRRVGVLLEQFKRTANAVLLATSSFWQGVDVAGDALSCVIIDKLPFASPGDPIVAARIEAIAARGGDAFDEYQVPLAILTLLQGLGRLLRHRARSRRARDSRPAPADDGLRPALPGVACRRRRSRRNLDDITRFFERHAARVK